jgi:hypothetical protein
MAHEDIDDFGIAIGICDRHGGPALDILLREDWKLHTHLTPVQMLQMLICLHKALHQMLLAQPGPPPPLVEFHEGTVVVLEHILQDERAAAQEETDGPNPTKH